MELTLEQLEFMDGAVEYVPDWNMSYEQKSLFYAAKQKIRELLMQRIGGQDSGFSWMLFDPSLCEFTSPKEDKDIPGWMADGMYVQCDDIDAIDFGLIPHDIDVSMSGLYMILDQFTDIWSGDLHIRADNNGEGESTAREFDRGDLYLLVKAVLGDGDISMYADRDQEETAWIFTDFLLAMDKAAEGFFEEALDDRLFYNVVYGVNDNMGGIYPPEFVIRNLGMLLYSYFFSSPDNPVFMTAFSSKEVFLYGKYREALPLDVRETMDYAIGMYERPVPYSDDIVTEYIDDKASHEILLLTDEGSYSLQDINIFWKDVRDFLAEKLPLLREEYYTGDITVSGSRYGSRTSFFVVMRLLLCGLRGIITVSFYGMC